MDEEDALAGPEVNAGAEHRRDLSSVPPKPVPSAPRERESLDGETIFAVGEDGDKWSDDEEDSRRGSTDRKSNEGDASERERLTSKRTD